MAFQVYADKVYYASPYLETEGETSIDDAILAKLLFRSSRFIDRLTYSRSTNFDNLSEDEQTAIKYAVCAQAEYEFLNGDPYKKSLSGSSDKLSIGSFSIEQGGKNSQGDSRQLDKVSPKAYEYLLNADLLFSGAVRKKPYTFQDTFETIED